MLYGTFIASMAKGNLTKMYAASAFEEQFLKLERVIHTIFYNECPKPRLNLIATEFEQ